MISSFCCSKNDVVEGGVNSCPPRRRPSVKGRQSGLWSREPQSRDTLNFSSMFKKALALLFGVLLLASVSSAQSSVTFAWNPSTDPSCNGYRVYTKAVTASSWTTNSLSGVSSTSFTFGGAVIGTLYQIYVTAVTTNNLESAPSNQVRYQYFQVNASGNPTALTLSDVNVANFPGFVLSQPPTSGTVNGTPPSVTYTGNSGFSKDQWTYTSPEIFSGINVSNTYAVYKTTLLPPSNLKATAN